MKKISICVLVHGVCIISVSKAAIRFKLQEIVKWFTNIYLDFPLFVFPYTGTKKENILLKKKTQLISLTSLKKNTFWNKFVVNGCLGLNFA